MLTLNDAPLTQNKAKLRQILSWYLASKRSQNFETTDTISFIHTLGLTVDAPDRLIDLVMDDLKYLLEPVFKYVVVDVTLRTIDKHKLSLLIELDCDGTTLKESITLNDMLLINNNPYKDAYLAHRVT